MLTIVVAGGLGTRLGLPDLPKAMVPIGGKPLLQHTLDCFLRQGFRDFLFKLGHRADAIESHFGDGRRFGCRIDYLREQRLLGTAGGLRFLERESDSVFVVYGDLLVATDLRRMLAFHRQQRAAATLLVHHSSHPEDSDVLELDERGRVSRLVHKPGNADYGTLTNAGIYLMRPECFSRIPDDRPFDFTTDLLPQLLREGVAVTGYETADYVKDAGTPARLAAVEDDLAEGRVSGHVEAVFLDRDGTINEEINLLHRPEDLRLLPNAAEAIRALNEARIPAIVVTNQPAVARNLCTERDIDLIHERMREELARHGAYVDAIYYCPHHPEKHHADGNPAYRIDCECRKPKIGMVRRGAEEFDLDLRRCVFVGDTSTDIATAAAAGTRSILVRTGYGGGDAKYAVQPDYVAEDLLEAVQLIRKLHGGHSA